MQAELVILARDNFKAKSMQCARRGYFVTVKVTVHPEMTMSWIFTHARLAGQLVKQKPLGDELKNKVRDC